MAERIYLTPDVWVTVYRQQAQLFHPPNGLVASFDFFFFDRPDILTFLRTLAKEVNLSYDANKGQVHSLPHNYEYRDPHRVRGRTAAASQIASKSRADDDRIDARLEVADENGYYGDWPGD